MPLRHGGSLTVPDNRWDLIPPPAAPPSVSVVIPYHEQQDELDRVLAGLALQRGMLRLVEVIVADDGSKEPPRVDNVALPPSVAVRIVSQERVGRRPAAARNLGAAVATGDVLVFLDADTVPMPDALAQLCALPAVAPEAVVVGERRHHDLSGWGTAELGTWLLGPEGGDGPPQLAGPDWLRAGYDRTGDLLEVDDRSYQWVISAILALSRPFFEELGGFDATIVGYSAEDWELAYRAWCAGAILAHRRSAVGVHDGGDWRLRAGPDALKNDERMSLAQRVPGLRDPLIGPFAPVLVFLPPAARSTGTGAPGARDPGEDHDAAVMASVCSLLDVFGTAARMVIADPSPAVRRGFAHDPRVVLGRLDPALSARSLVRLDLYDLVDARSGALDAILAAVAPGGPGRARLEDDQGLLAVVTATRAAARAERWRAAAGSLDAGIERLFGTARAPASTAGLVRAQGRVDLDVVLPR